MNKKYIILSVAALFLVASTLTSCSQAEESPEPTKKEKPGTTKPPPPPPPPPSADTMAMFTANQWTTKKLFKNGAEQTGHFLIGTFYLFSNGGSYSFNIPGFPSANGTWAFDASGKNKVNVTNQAGTQVWKILAISTTALVIEETEANGDIWKYEYTH